MLKYLAHTYEMSYGENLDFNCVKDINKTVLKSGLL